MGDWVIRPTWNRALGFRGGVAPVMKGSMDSGLWGCIDSVGNVVVETSYELAMPFFDGLGLFRILSTGGDMRIGLANLFGSL
ncbi:MAG: WG repeat-containing protein [Candidatus Dadabacteria bacterium]|nr:WG repeat-containing protein [Candidatus Dadabacteria bacterium]